MNKKKAKKNMEKEREVKTAQLSAVHLYLRTTFSSH